MTDEIRKAIIAEVLEQVKSGAYTIDKDYGWIRTKEPNATVEVSGMKYAFQNNIGVTILLSDEEAAEFIRIYATKDIERLELQKTKIEEQKAAIEKQIAEKKASLESVKGGNDD